uniref:Uncharacterized protein n=1 Tax=Timema douglasi TaxID=61478 RepID=A0A7R8VR63_TIMDO|nr:unnamed protein product [Timema douglasi]
MDNISFHFAVSSLARRYSFSSGDSSGATRRIIGLKLDTGFGGPIMSWFSVIGGGTTTGSRLNHTVRHLEGDIAPPQDTQRGTSHPRKTPRGGHRTPTRHLIKYFHQKEMKDQDILIGLYWGIHNKCPSASGRLNCKEVHPYFRGVRAEKYLGENHLRAPDRNRTVISIFSMSGKHGRSDFQSRLSPRVQVIHHETKDTLVMEHLKNIICAVYGFLVSLFHREWDKVCSWRRRIVGPVGTDDLARGFVPRSVNYHLTRQCNYACGFCFHTAKTSFVLPRREAECGLRLLKQAGQVLIHSDQWSIGPSL